MNYKVSNLKTGCESFGVTLTDLQIEQFLKYYEMLVEKNKVMNLTAITEFDDVVTKHFIDSVSIASLKSFDKTGHYLDIGTGAGFPGIPLKIAFPELEITLMDSLNKRVNFLNEVIDELGLEKINAFHFRAEEAARQKEHREQYDYVVSRAVANLSTLSEYCLPFIKIGGSFISYKSGEVDEELNDAKSAIKKLGGEISGVSYFDLPDSDIKRSFIIIEKKNKTPKTYPRKAGTPAKEPLK